MRVISYLRVSTARQGASGLGLEAQRAAVDCYLAAGAHEKVAEYVEVESGAKASRPQLTAALAACRLHRATLVIAKLDRLARNVAFIANLMDGGVDFVACDLPHANRLTLHLLAAIAEHERDMISQRTKAALAAAKARGTKLGNPMGAMALSGSSMRAAEASATRRASLAHQHRSAAGEAISTLLTSGMTTRRQIASALNAQAIPSPSGGIWYEEQVRRVMESMDVEAA